MIPKRIFSTMIFNPTSDPFTEKAYRCFYDCFESWHRLMPDWDIRIITVENLFDYGYSKWAEDRMNEGNFIAVSHWARNHWLWQRGGVYVDIDVQAVKRFDSVLDAQFFCGHEGGDPYANNAVMGAVPKHWFSEKMLDYTVNFPMTHPEWANETGPRMITKLLRDCGWTGNRNETMRVGKDILVHNSKVFYPYFWKEQFTPECITPETVAIHHWASTWVKP